MGRQPSRCVLLQPRRLINTEPGRTFVVEQQLDKVPIRSANSPLGVGESCASHLLAIALQERVVWWHPSVISRLELQTCNSSRFHQLH